MLVDPPRARMQRRSNKLKGNAGNIHSFDYLISDDPVEWLNRENLDRMLRLPLLPWCTLTIASNDSRLVQLANWPVRRLPCSMSMLFTTQTRMANRPA